MKLTCLGSSSKGNCYILEGKSHKLILEAGVKFEEVKQALDFNYEYVAGCIITHEHNDHIKYIDSFLKNGIKLLRHILLTTAETMEYFGFEKYEDELLCNISRLLNKTNNLITQHKTEELISKKKIKTKIHLDNEVDTMLDEV